MPWGSPTSPAPEAANELSPQEWLDKREALLLAWDAAKKTLEAAKETEMTARKAVADFAFPMDTRVRGKTNNQDLPNGYKLKLGDKINPKITANNETIEKVEETVIPTISNEAPFLFARIMKVKYDFSIGEYNKLDMQNPAHVALKGEIDKLIEMAAGSPSLEIVPPKDTL